VHEGIAAVEPNYADDLFLLARQPSLVLFLLLSLSVRRCTTVVVSP
jgi:hypothetical protein